MATTRKARAKAPEAVETSEPRYEIKALAAWCAVDRANVLKDGCLHWEIGESYGLAPKGKWRSVK